MQFYIYTKLNRLNKQISFIIKQLNGKQNLCKSNVTEYKHIWVDKWGKQKYGLSEPHLLSCHLPTTHQNKTPISVSIVDEKCDMATNNLRVIYDKPLVQI